MSWERLLAKRIVLQAATHDFAKRGPDGFWWREATDELPAILWTYHPERKAKSLVEIWLQQASRLVI
jgi:hypothetical protein